MREERKTPLSKAADKLTDCIAGWLVLLLLLPLLLQMYSPFSQNIKNIYAAAALLRIVCCCEWMCKMKGDIPRRSPSSMP